MFIVLLKFSDNRNQASQFMASHNAWLKRGFDDGVFFLSGSLQPRLGGAIIAGDISRSALQERIGDDPFVAAQVVSAEILDIAPAQTEPRLAHLLG